MYGSLKNQDKEENSRLLAIQTIIMVMQVQDYQGG